MQSKQQELFTTVRTEGSVLPPDLLQRVADGDADIAGMSPSDYHLPGERINEAVGRSWNRLQGCWVAFRHACEKLPSEDAGTSVVRERWLLPLFQELGYGRLQLAKSIEIEGKTYPISHAWQHTPIHLVSFRADLDKRSPGVTGASKASPHSLVQELLNREEGYLWGFVSNGLRLRVLRDNKSLTRQAFVEFDLQAMMDGQVYPDFKLLWLLCHQSRVEGERPDQCWLEKWSQTAIKQGTRALDSLRDGVQRAIEALGRGFLSHPANRTLRDRLQAGSLDKQDYYRQLLRLVYRLLFLFVAEDRGVLFDPKSPATARERYSRFYSTQRLRTLAGSIRGTPHADLYLALHLIFSKLDQTGCPELGLPALGSFLWSADALSELRDARITNRDLLDAIRELAFTTDGQARRPVDYKNLGAEELGSIYESLLELHPQIHTDAGTFALGTTAGHERKTTGSYYTPTSLVNCLLDSALEPVLDDAVKGGEGYKERGATAADRVLSLKVCDPACGSGHFLIAAAHRMAKRLAAVRTGEEEPAPEVYRHALRDVIGHCIYGVDLNPMAVELCKVSLWMEALEPGRPLSFLDHRIQVGNSLIGATPALLARGIPDEAFEPVEGDEKALCKAFKKQNRDERRGQTHLSHEYQRRPWEQLGNLAASLAQVDALSDETIDGVQLKQRSYEDLVKSSSYETGRLFADAWCASFPWKKTKDFDYPITEGVFRRIGRNPRDVAPWMRDEIRVLAGRYQFFHWHLAFPDVFRPVADGHEREDDGSGWTGGFSVVLGNPPWERVNLKEQEWFADRRPDIAAAGSAERKRKIAELEQADRPLYGEYQLARRKADAEGHYIRASGRFPLCGRGDVNVYAVFAEAMSNILCSTGRVGCIVPSGIATDDTTRLFFRHIVEAGSLKYLFDFENKGLFAGVHNSYKFCLLTLSSVQEKSTRPADFVFFAHDVSDLLDPARRFTLSQSDIGRLNPNSFTCPVFRSARDAIITKAAHEKFPILAPELTVSGASRWEIEIGRMFHSSEDAPLFDEDGGPESLRLYEAKYFSQFDHRFATFDGKDVEEVSHQRKGEAALLTRSRYGVRRSSIPAKFARRLRLWFLSFRKIARSTDSRTLVSAILPECGVIDSATNIYVDSASDALCLLAMLNGFVIDYIARQKIGGPNMTVGIVSQLPVPPPETLDSPGDWHENGPQIRSWLLNRALELSFTACDLEVLSREVGYAGPPFRWEEDRRFQIRCELDAACFRLYGMSRDDVEYILETFPIVKRRDIEKYGQYRTKETILAIYDEMADAARTGRPYRTRLNPPPGPPANVDGLFKPLPEWAEGQARPTGWPPHIHPPHHAGGAGSRPAAHAVVTAARGTDPELIVRAFLDTREGMSSDYVVAAPDANSRFLARARKLGVGGSDFDINHWLLNARKAGRLKGEPTETEYRLPEAFEPWVFASEWAGRHLQRQLVSDTDRMVTLDDILCDPSLAARFDEAAARIKPGFTALEYRWAAFSQRKRGKAKPAAKTLKVSLNRQMTLDEAMGQAPHGPGLYLIRAGPKPVYLNHTADLNSQIHRHREVSAGQLVPEWLTQGVGEADELVFEHLIGINRDRLREARISSVAELRPWLNLLDLEGAA